MAYIDYDLAKRLQDAGFPRYKGRLINYQRQCIKPNNEIVPYHPREDYPAYPREDELREALNQDCQNFPWDTAGYYFSEAELAEQWIECISINQVTPTI